MPQWFLQKRATCKCPACVATNKLWPAYKREDPGASDPAHMNGQMSIKKTQASAFCSSATHCKATCEPPKFQAATRCKRRGNKQQAQYNTKARQQVETDQNAANWLVVQSLAATHGRQVGAVTFAILLAVSKTALPTGRCCSCSLQAALWLR